MSNDNPDERKRRSMDEAQREFLNRDREYHRIREMLAVREKELEAYRDQVRREHRDREEMLMKEFADRERQFRDREQALLEREKEQERLLMRRQHQIENLRQNVTTEIAEKEAALTKALQELQQEKEKYNEESRKRLETKSSDYVVSTLEILEKKENRFHMISRIWSYLGAASLVFGIGLLTYLTLDSLILIPEPISWPYIVFVGLKGVVVVALLGAFAKYAYLFSSSYMREALKNADRRHAINFGKFYLQSYGAAADWSQVQDAFKHWNTNGENAFSKASDIDFTSLSKAAESLDTIAKLINKSKE
jgi:hypothetical protein